MFMKKARQLSKTPGLLNLKRYFTIARQFHFVYKKSVSQKKRDSAFGEDRYRESAGGF
jgi:hypothetical protein